MKFARHRSSSKKLSFLRHAKIYQSDAGDATAVEKEKEEHTESGEEGEQSSNNCNSQNTNTDIPSSSSFSAPRSRLDTADTLRMSNRNDDHLNIPSLLLPNASSMDADEMDNPFLEGRVRRRMPEALIGCSSTVSSLRSGSFQIPDPQEQYHNNMIDESAAQQPQATAATQPPVVPKVIYCCQPVPKEEQQEDVPDWLQMPDDATASTLGSKEPINEEKSPVVKDIDDDTTENHPSNPLIAFRPRISLSAFRAKSCPTAAPVPESTAKATLQAPRAPLSPSQVLQQQVSQQRVPASTTTPLPPPVRTDLATTKNNEIRPTLGRYQSLSSSKINVAMLPNETVNNVIPTPQPSTAAAAAFPCSPSAVMAAAPLSPNTSKRKSLLKPLTARCFSLSPQSSQQSSQKVVLPASWVIPEGAAAANSTKHSSAKSKHKRIQSHDTSLLGSLWTASTVSTSDTDHHQRRTPAVVSELRAFATRPKKAVGAGVDTEAVANYEWIHHQHHSATGCWT